MNGDFLALAKIRQSCRGYAASPVEAEKLMRVMEAAILAPSACNSQPYHFTVCKGKAARAVAEATQGMGMNSFTSNCPVMIVISENDYNGTARIGAKIKGNDYRSIDIGIAAAYLTAEAASLGLGTCILGWFDEKKLQKLLGTEKRIRLVISLGYPSDPAVRKKKRKSYSDIVTEIFE